MHVNIDPLQKQALDDAFDAFTMLIPGSIVSLMHVGAGYTRYTASAVDLFGLPGEYVADGAIQWTDWIHPEDRKAYLDATLPLVEGTSRAYDLNYRVRTVSGEYVNFHLLGAALRDGDGKPSLIVGVMFNEGLTADVDPVTVLPNREAYQKDLTEFMNQGKGTYTLQVGLGGFSGVNRVHGYSFGNRILQEAAWLIQECVRDRGKVYRFEGPVFAILSDTLTRQESIAIYDYIRYQFQRGIEINGTNLTFAASGGMISTFSSDVDAATIRTSLNYAYTQSHDHMHGDLVDFNGSVNYDRLESLEMLNVLRASATDYCRGFRMEYIPVLSAADEHLNGAEAVIVWEDERYGRVDSQDFVQLLERDFVFEEISEFMIEQSFCDGVKLLERDPDFLLCLNVYRIQLDSDYFVDNLVHYLRKTGFPAHLLSVKFDSDCRNIGIERMREIIDKLHEHGILVIIGDFGVGADSIGFLKSEPVDAVSIDMRFVGEIADDDRERSVLSHLAELANVYVEHVNVKGIDTEQLRDIVRTLPASTLQGAYYAGSLPLQDFIAKYYPASA